MTDRILRADGLMLDVDNRQVTGPTGTYQLTPMECRLLKTFMLRPGRVATRAFLMKEVWETDYLGDTRTLDVHVCWLRKKIEKNPRHPRYIRTVPKAGYRFGIE